MAEKIYQLDHPDWWVGGWQRTEEDFNGLLASSYDGWRDIPVPMMEPEELDPRDWYRIENQKQQGACQGWMLSGAGEFCYRMATEGDVMQFSAQACYIWSQIRDGIVGDRGSTLQAGEHVAKEDGYLPEDYWPYDGQYHTQPIGGKSMAQCRLEAQKRKLLTTSALKSYDDVKRWLASGFGPTGAGITWNSSMNQPGNVVEHYDPNGQGGGHAILFPGYTKRKDRKGRNYLLLPNSWGKTWGLDGWKEVSPEAVDAMFAARYTVWRGYSDMRGDAMRPRPIDYVTQSYKRGGRYTKDLAS